MSVEHLYLHVPYCAAKCPYCDFNSIAGREDEFEAYVEALLSELRGLPRGPYRSIFIGGGTPTALDAPVLSRLLSGIRDHVDLASDYEWTCEANPGSSDAERFQILADHGVNRISIGIQAVQDHHLRFLGRIHDRREGELALAIACERFERVSADCIVALPGQTVDEVAETVDLYRRYALDHASLYHLAIEPGTEFHARHARGALREIDPEQSRRLLDLVHDRLAELGLPAYETSNFARPGSECRHNLAYWRQRDYHAAGAGAVSTVTGERITREPHPARYIAAIQARGSACWRRELLTAGDRLVEAWMLGLRLHEGVARRRLRELGDSEDRWLPIAEALAAEGLVRFDDERVALSRDGRSLQDAITVRLLPEA